MARQQSGEATSGLPARLWRPLADILAILLILTAMAWALNVPRYLNLGFYPQQFFALILAFVLAIAYLTFPAIRGTKREILPWYDLVLAAASFITVFYIAVNYPELVYVR